MMNYFRTKGILWKAVMKYDDLLPMFTESLVKSIGNENAYEFIGANIEKAEFRASLLPNLPFSINIEKLVPLYRELSKQEKM